MKVILKIRATILMISFLLCMPVIADDANDDKAIDAENNLKGITVTIANGEWPPFFSKNLKHYGVVSRIVQEAFAQEGVTIKYVFRPWNRGLEEAAKGKWHGTVGWMKNEYRQKHFYFTEPIEKYSYHFFQRKDNPIEWETLSDLKDAIIGAVVGYYYGEEFAKVEDERMIQVLRGYTDRSAFRNLLDKRIDLVIEESEVGNYIIHIQLTPEEADQVESQDKVLYSADAFLLLSKNKKESQQLVKLFNHGLKKLKESGKIEQYWQEARKDKYPSNKE